MSLLRRIAPVLLALQFVFGVATTHARETAPVAWPIIGYDARFNPTPSREGMVASSEEIASRVGARILAEGGNAIDAAVATGSSAPACPNTAAPMRSTCARSL